MIDRDRFKMPYSVEEAAELLLNEMGEKYKRILFILDRQSLDKLNVRMSKYINDDFKVWEGNYRLLDSCFKSKYHFFLDPAKIIIYTMRDILHSKMKLLSEE